VIGITVATAGPLVAFGFLVLPVLTAAAFASSLRSNLWLSMLTGLVISLAGFGLSYHFDFPLGDSVVATGCAVLLLARLVRRVGFFREPG
jgi:ABC-type Mn2+/Zn2+ transport system permease subunit